MSGMFGKISPVFLILLFAASHSAFAANPDAYSPQDVLIGATPSVQASANNGKGVVFGDIDTGITPQWVGFAPQYNGQGLSNINMSSSAVCLNGKCPTGVFPTDENGHGTFTASEIVGGIPGVGLEGVAPAGTLISVQVLNANGSGASNDVANGIVYAVNHGAEILNLSLGPSGAAAQEAAFYESLASAINYAASKNVIIVFAGGNSSQALAGGTNITGFTNAAIQHMIFMGSTNASEKLSTFSNTPGSGKFISTTGQSYAYSNMWMMADGENIWGASNYYTKQYGYSYITQDSGTSMAAPQATGAAGLLAARWPNLIASGTIPQILELTATDLGTKGVDATYGDGFLNVAAAMQPIGTLTVKTGNGQSVPVSSLESTVSGGGALGLSSISSHLASYTVFDSFARNYTENLSSLIAIKPNVSAVAQTAIAPKVTMSSTHFADGGSLSFGSTENDVTLAPAFGEAPGTQGWFMSYTDAAGTTMAGGSGFPASASFDEALWGNKNSVASEASLLTASHALASLAEGGTFAAYGTPLSKDSRFAVSWSQTQQDNTLSTGWNTPNASSMSVGYSRDLAQGVKGGLTFSVLNEQNGLLGTTYYTGGPLSFGGNNRSMSVGASSVIAVGKNTDLLFDAAITRTDGAGFSGGILSDSSPLFARSLGAALAQRNAVESGDNLTFSLNAPLRVYSGSASLAMTGVDTGGNPLVTSQRVCLTPNGNEVDLTMSYKAPVRDGFQWNFSVEGSRDPQNIAGTSDVTALTGLSLSF